jgi:alpha-1,2-mannosyltransferase
LIILNCPPRPEKDHKAQILAFHQLIQDHPEHLSSSDGSGPVKLVLIGGSRNAADAKRITALEELVKQLGIAVG